MFKRFQAIYGPRFTSRLDGQEELVVQEWSAALAGLSGEQVKAGLARCRARPLQSGQEDWPPTPSEFRQWCLDLRGAPYHRDAPRLQAPRADRDKALQQLQAIRERLW